MENQSVLKPHVVLYPCTMSMGHVFPFMDLATKLVAHHGFSVTIIAAQHKEASVARLFASYLEALNSEEIRLLELAQPKHEEKQVGHPLLRYISIVENSNNALHDLLVSCRQDRSQICGIIIDFFHMAAIDVIAELSIPAYLLSTSSAANLCLKFHLPNFMAENPDFRDRPNDVLQIPGVWPMAVRDMSELLLDKSSPAMATAFVGLCSRLPLLTGIFANSFSELEDHAVRTLQQKIPKIYPVGPLLCSSSVEFKAVQERGGAECLRWLDGQPDSSVVYVSFGSWAFMSTEQIAEIALGLESSGRRFLWVVRGQKEVDISLLLPQGFEKRVKGRGLLVPSWAPQIQILSHPAVGGFVSHCGWNSALEGFWYGVPFAAWPLYAEQRMNCLFIVTEVEVGLEVKKSEDGNVKREEVQRVVEELMGGEQGDRVRKRVKEVSKKAREAVEENTGSSFKNLKAAAIDFIDDLQN